MLQQVRLACRTWRRRRGVAALIVATISIGLTGTVVIFSLADAILWHPLPFRDPARLVSLWTVYDDQRQPTPLVRLAALDAWARKSQVFSAVYAYGTGGFTVRGRGDAESVSGGVISLGLFSALGVAPRTGRDFVAADFVARSEPVVLIGNRLSRTQFGERQSAVGEWLNVDGRPFRIVGIMPPDFSFPFANVQLWIPIGGQPKTSDFFYAVGRVRDGLSQSAASAAVETLTRGLRDPAGRPLGALRTRPFARPLPQTGLVLAILAAIVGLVLLVAIANAANLLLADAVQREQELTTRAAIGASAAQLARQLLTEAGVLIAAASVVAIALAYGVVDLVATSLPRSMSFQTLRPVAVDWRTALFAVAAAAATTVVVSLVPLWRLRHVANGLSRRGDVVPLAGERTRSILVAAQIAVAAVVLVAAGLLARGFVRLQRADLGFDPANLLTVSVQMRGEAFRANAVKQRFLEDWRRAAAALPGVLDATIAESIPPQLGLESGPIETADGRSVAEGATIAETSIDAGFLRTLRIPLLRGAVPDGAVPVDGRRHVVVSKSFAELAWPDADPVGQTFRLARDAPVYVVDGVAGDVPNGSVDSPLGTLAKYGWRTGQGNVWPFQTLILRTDGPTEPVIRGVREIVRRLNPDVPVATVNTAQALIIETNARLRFATWLMVVFGATAAALALVGVLGAFSCTVRQRRRELAVRMALGAQSADVIRMVLRSSGLCALAGLAAGLPAAFAAARTLRTLLFQISPADPATFTAVSVACFCVALAASWYPASRACRVDPAETLRAE